jgi:Domain of unknown function (DUF4384)
MTLFRTRHVSSGALFALFWILAPAIAQDEDSSRSVRIIDGSTIPTPPPSTASPPQSRVEPSAPATQPGSPPGPKGEVPGALATSPNLAPPTAQPGVPPVVTFSPSPTPLSTPSGHGIPVVANPAELSIEMLPETSIAIGSRVSFRISAKKPGYLILVDVDSTGKLTQIYPSPASLMAGRGKPNANFVKPGKPIQIPSPLEPYAGFEFVASPPPGTAMVVAILCDQSVQMVDLPDIPGSLAGQTAALALLSKLAGELRIPSARYDEGRLQRPTWSLSARFYEIRQTPD